MQQTQQQLIKVNGIQLSVHIAGPESGKPVWLLHGFPECWYSWRHQITALAAQGYRVFAPEMRGYGATEAPEAVEAYDLITICGDIQGAMNHFGHEQVAMIGHDWGAPIAWHLALLEPARVKAVCGLSVPFGGRPRQPAINMMREAYKDKFHYMLYFQTQGPAEAELAADIPRTMRLMMHGLDSQAGGALVQDKPADSAWLEDYTDPGRQPAWCSDEAFEVYVKTFKQSGFRGPINWYRNFERNWERTESLAGRQIEQPALFLIGDRDPVGALEAYTIKKMPSVVPQVEQHVIADCGHWIQAEKPSEVNSLLLPFLERYFPAT